jgi:hypothetical protein
MRQGRDDENAYSSVLLKPEERSYLGDQVVDGGILSKWVLRKGVIGIHLAEDRANFGPFLNTVTNVWVL